MGSLGREDPLEEDMATHSSIPAWEIPRTEEPGGSQSVELHESDTTEHEHEERQASLVKQTCLASVS